MELLDQLEVLHPGGRGWVRLMVGDVTAIPADQAVDLLIVSAFPYSHGPGPGTVMEALLRAGVDMQRLSIDPEVDLRTTTHSWLSRPLRRPELNVDRIMCFEQPRDVPISAQGAVDDLFRGLVPYATTNPIRRVTTSLLSTGNQGKNPVEMLKAVVLSAARWMAAGLTIDQLNVVVFERTDPATIRLLAEEFAELRRTLAASEAAANEPSQSGPDVFISYAREDKAAVDHLMRRIHELDPSVNVFVDTAALSTGALWQRELFDALERAKQIVCLYSRDYLASGPCLDEFHIGYLRSRDNSAILTPAYLRDTDLPTYMKLVQYIDVREINFDLLDEFAAHIVDRVSNGPDGPRTPTRTAPSTARQATGPSSLMSLISILQQLDEDRVDVDLTIKLRIRSSDPDTGTQV